MLEAEPICTMCGQELAPTALSFVIDPKQELKRLAAEPEDK